MRGRNPLLIAAMLAGLGGVVGIAPPPERCPECGRRKARNATDAQNGFCPKWWAITDPAAEQDCVEVVKAQGEPHA